MSDSLQRTQIQQTSVALPWLVWSCPVFFYFFQFAIRVSPSVLADDIMADLSLQAYAMGALASWYYIGYTGMQIPVGLLIDRVGVRLPLFFAALLCVLGCYLFAITDNLFVMSLGRLMTGVGSAFGFLSCVKIASVWFPPQKLGLIIGLSMMIGTMGATFGEAPLSEMADALGWRLSVQLLAIMGLILAFYCLFVVRDHKTQVEESIISREKNKNWAEPIFEVLKEILRSKHTYIFGLYGGMMYVQLSGFADLWGPQFIAQTYGEDKSLSAAVVTMIYVGIAMGAPLSALLADYLRSYRKVMLLGALGCLLPFSIHLYAIHLPFESLYVVYFLIGLFSGAQFLCFAAVCDDNSKSKTGAASGIHNMMCMTSGIIFQPLIGYLLDLTWDGKIIDGYPFYSQHSYSVALVVIPISLAIAALACVNMKETYIGRD